MPYVSPRRRDALNQDGARPQNVGELTYRLVRECLWYLSGQVGPHFQQYAEILGALESAKLETYRRVIGPYEDEKRAEHGDVYP
jgi:hypothetical protein